MTAIAIIYAVIGLWVSWFVWWICQPQFPEDDPAVTPLAIVVTGALWPVAIVASVWWLTSPEDRE